MTHILQPRYELYTALILRIVGIWVSGLLTPDVSNEPTAFIFMRQGTARRKSITLFLSAMTQNTKIVNIFNVLNKTGDVQYV